MTARRACIALVTAPLLLLAACGAQQALAPAKGKNMPPKAATSPTAPTADQLLTPSSAVRPGRSDELLRKSQPRSDDRFDLPPH
jgi:hypothetical protein